MGRSLAVVISGYYGFKNSGDEAVLQAIIQALRNEAENKSIHLSITVLSADPTWTMLQYSVQAVHRMKIFDVIKAIKSADALISGGGSLLQDVTGWKTIPYYLGIIYLAQRLKKQVFIYSQGLGPVNRKMFNGWIAAVFNKCTMISVRDKDSAAYLNGIGISTDRILEVPDPVMGLKSGFYKPKEISKHLPAVIGVSVRFWQQDLRELIAIGKGLAELAKRRNVTFKILPFHQPSDAAASAKVCELMIKAGVPDERINWVIDAFDPLEMMRHVEQCDVLVGMRLHALIYAATRCVPCAGISYDPKIDRFLRQIDETAVASTGNLDAFKLTERIEWLMDRKMEWIQTRLSRIQSLQELSVKPAQLILEALNDNGREQTI